MHYLAASLMFLSAGLVTANAAEMNLSNIERTGATSERAIIMSSINLDSDLGQVARTVYAEARGENAIEKKAVASVIRNRVESPSFPDTYEDVVTQPYQFSALLKSDPNRPAYENPARHARGDSRSQKALNESVEAAYFALLGTMDIAQGATLYYSPRSMKPAGALPKWDFSKLEEIIIPGVRSTHFRFFRERGYESAPRVDWLANLCTIFPTRPLMLMLMPAPVEMKVEVEQQPLMLAAR